jgi:CheY-like chemotaxis protein
MLPPIRSEKIKSNVRLLVVEDDPDTAEMLKNTLRNWFELVDVYRNPHEVADMFKTGMYNLAILDYGLLPEMSGFDLYNKIKQTDPDIKVCVISGYDITRAIPESKIYKEFETLSPPLKPDHILTKPFDGKMLFSKLWQILIEDGSISDIEAKNKEQGFASNNLADRDNK